MLYVLKLDPDYLVLVYQFYTELVIAFFSHGSFCCMYNSNWEFSLNRVHHPIDCVSLSDNY